VSISRHGKIWWLDIRVKGKRIRRSLKTENRNEALARYAPLRERLLEKHLGEKEDEIWIKGKGDKLRTIPLNETTQEIIARQPRPPVVINDAVR